MFSTLNIRVQLSVTSTIINDIYSLDGLISMIFCMCRLIAHILHEPLKLGTFICDSVIKTDRRQSFNM